MKKELKPFPPEAIDTTNKTQEYWEEILRREGLSMTRGMFPHAYVGGSPDVEACSEISNKVKKVSTEVSQ